MKGLLDLTSDDCRWPLDSRCDHDLIMYCGERVGRGSYCVMHADLAYRWERRVPTAVRNLPISSALQPDLRIKHGTSRSFQRIAIPSSSFSDGVFARLDRQVGEEFPF